MYFYVDMDPAYHPRDYIQPGPHDRTLLYLQSQHRSEAIWHDQVDAEVFQLYNIRSKPMNYICII